MKNMRRNTSYYFVHCGTITLSINILHVECITW